jgi:hypothetical protein
MSPSLWEWETFVAEVARIAGVEPGAVARDRFVVEDGLLDSLAISELCMLVYSHCEVDLLDASGVYRFPGLTWEGLHELVNPDTAFLPMPPGASRELEATP